MLLQKIAFRPIYLASLTLVFVMFSRVFSAVGLPKSVDFIHFGIVLLALFFIAIRLKKITVIAIPIIGLLVSFVLSGIWNEAGVVNVVLGFLLLAEPFLLILILSMLDWQEEDVIHFRFLICFVIFLHVLFSYFQSFALGAIDDDVKGIFIGMNNGHHIGGALSMVAVVYFYTVAWLKSPVVKTLIYLLLFSQVVMSDAKQVVLVFLIAGFIYLFLFDRAMNLMSKLLIVSLGVLFTSFLVLFVQGFSAWVDVDVILEGGGQKLSVFFVEVDYYESIVNWFLGLGPGHSISRLGWLIPEYYQILEPIGVTYHDASAAIMFANQGHWISNSITGSSLFSLLYSFAGVWGDLGLMGLSFYMLSWWYVWKQYAVLGSGKLLLIAAFVFGWVFAYLEEPGFTMFLCAVLVLIYQENTVDKKE